jgi:hypothetical protein
LGRSAIRAHLVRADLDGVGEGRDGRWHEATAAAPYDES